MPAVTIAHPSRAYNLRPLCAGLGDGVSLDAGAGAGSAGGGFSFGLSEGAIGAIGDIVGGIASAFILGQAAKAQSRDARKTATGVALIQGQTARAIAGETRVAATSLAPIAAGVIVLALLTVVLR